MGFLLRPEIAFKTLTDSLKALEEDGLVNRKEYPQVPPKVEYSLTEKGTSLIPIIKGVLLLLQDLLSDLPVQEAANANLELLQELGLENEFSDTRQKGLRAAFAMLTDAAKADCTAS